jgi:hypothetical protein
MKVKRVPLSGDLFFGDEKGKASISLRYFATPRVDIRSATFPRLIPPVKIPSDLCLGSLRARAVIRIAGDENRSILFSSRFHSRAYVDFKSETRREGIRACIRTTEETRMRSTRRASIVARLNDEIASARWRIRGISGGRCCAT